MAKIISPCSDDSPVSCTLIRWLKSDGELVFEDDAIAELETDNATMDIAAWASGILRHIAKPGDRLSARKTVDEFARIEPTATK